MSRKCVQVSASFFMSSKVDCRGRDIRVMLALRSIYHHF